MTANSYVASYRKPDGEIHMKFFEFLSTNHDINRFVFATVICYCVVEAVVAVYRGAKARKTP